MLAFRLFPPPHGMPMAGEGVPHTKCGTKRARRAAPETRAERSSLQCPPSAGGLRCGLRCAEVAAQNSPSRESLFCRDMCCGAVGNLPSTYRVPTEHLSDACRALIGRPSYVYRVTVGACRIPIKYNAAEMIRDFPERATQRKRAERTGITTFQLCRTLPPSARRQNKICSLILL